MPDQNEAERFEILEKLGAGGMGEVFRARDRKLNRFVALKFLPATASEGTRERFAREAQVVAALNHPNICTLFETGEQDGRPYLVLELLEGESLRARLRRGPLDAEPWSEAALELAEALDAAHRAGILHRDLKPDNIWLTTGGHVKVLDFGLAKMQTESLSEAVTVTGTVASDMLTRPGMTMGTFPYMSPEQARGEELDARSDLFSLGAVLYEMASGKAAFGSQSSSETMAAILRDQPPPLREVRPELAPEIERMVSRCLEKDPDLRYQSAADLRADLKRWKRASSSTASAAAISAPALAPVRPSRPRWIGYLVAAVVVIVAGLTYWQLRPRGPSAPPQLQFRQITFNGQVQDAVISRDGKFLAYTEATPKGTDLRLLNIPTGSDVEIVPAGGSCCVDPTFSPDGSYVYYVAPPSLFAVPVLGGLPRVIIAKANSGAGFSPDGKQIAFIRDSYPQGMALLVANADGTAERTLAEVHSPYFVACDNESAGLAPRAPAWSADGKHIAIDRFHTEPLEEHLVVVDVANGQIKPLGAGQVGGFSDLAWLPNGTGILATGAVGGMGSSVSEIMRYAYPQGTREQWTNDLQGYSDVTLAGDGSMAVIHASPQSSVWVRPAGADNAVQLPGGGDDMAGSNGVAWTPGGKLLSTRQEGNRIRLWQSASDGSGAQPIAMPGVPAAFGDIRVAPNGQILLQAVSEKRVSIWRVNADGSGATQLAPNFNLTQRPQVIRGGKEVAFLAFEQRAQHLYWMPLSGGTPQQLYGPQVSSISDAVSPDGNELFTLGMKGAVVLDLSGNTVHVSEVKNLPQQPWQHFSWTPDGKAITYVKTSGLADNIWAFPIAGGAAKELTHFKNLTIFAYAFSRHGQLAVSRGANNSNVVIATHAVN